LRGEDDTLGEPDSVLETRGLDVYNGVSVDVFDTVIVLDTELVVVDVMEFVIVSLTVTEAESEAETDTLDESEPYELPVLD
jgi:hypothetical protein